MRRQLYGFMPETEPQLFNSAYQPPTTETTESVVFFLYITKLPHHSYIVLYTIDKKRLFNFFSLFIRFTRKMFGHIEINVYICIVFFMVLDLF